MVLFSNPTTTSGDHPAEGGYTGTSGGHGTAPSGDGGHTAPSEDHAGDDGRGTTDSPAADSCNDFMASRSTFTISSNEAPNTCAGAKLDFANVDCIHTPGPQAGGNVTKGYDHHGSNCAGTFSAISRNGIGVTSTVTQKGGKCWE